MDAATIANLRKRIEELEAERQQAVAVANARTGAIGELMRLIEATAPPERFSDELRREYEQRTEEEKAEGVRRFAQSARDSLYADPPEVRAAQKRAKREAEQAQPASLPLRAGGA